MLNMFQQREQTVRWIFAGVLFLVSIGMVITFVPGGLFEGGGNQSDFEAARVDGHTISVQQWQTALQQQIQNSQIPQSLAEQIYGKSILNSLIAHQALVDEAHRQGIRATRKEIADAIYHIAPNQLYPGGKFVGPQAYASFVDQYFHTSVEGFEKEVGDELTVQKLQLLLSKSVQVTDAQVRTEFNRRNETATFDYVVLDPTQIAKTITPTSQQLQTFYNQHLANYMAPEQRQLDVLVASPAQLAAQIQIPDSKVQEYYQQNLGQYKFPERVKVSHILIKPASKAAADMAAAKQKAEMVLKKVQAGGNFAALAKQYSQDPGSADGGGELGWIQRGQTVPQFEQTAFSLKPGQISGLVQTTYGFHIIKVEDHQQAHTEPLSQVHDQIVQQLKQQKSLDQAQTAIDKAGDEDRSMPLSQIAQQLHLQYVQTPLISRNDPVAGIGTDAQFTSAAFGTGLNDVTPVVTLQQGGFAIARVKQIQPPRQQPFTAVQAQVEQDYRAAQSKILAQQQAQQLASLARSKGLKAAAASMHLTVKTSPALTSDASLGNLGGIHPIAATLFKLKPGQVGPAATIGGDNIVYSLDSIALPSDAQFQQQQNDIRSALLSQRQQDAFNTFQAAVTARLQKEGKIKINEKAIARAMGNGPEGA